MSLPAEEIAIAGAVLYSSLFEFPLTIQEVENSLLLYELNGSSVYEIFQRSCRLQTLLEFRDGYFVPWGKTDFIETRRKREKDTRELLARHQFVLKLVCTIPFTRMVGLSGSAAHFNVSHDADIDLMIICRGKRVWSIALAAVVLTRLLGCRDRVCFNYILSDSRLGIERKDLFNASQIVHIKPLIGHDVYQKFLAANPFVWAFYPNFKKQTAPDLPCPGHLLRAVKGVLELLLRPGLGRLVEWLCKRIYRNHLLRRSSSWLSPEEVVLGDDVLKLHTRSHRRRIMDAFEQLLNGLP